MSDNAALQQRIKALRDKYDEKVKTGETAEAATVAAELNDLLNQVRKSDEKGFGGPDQPWIR